MASKPAGSPSRDDVFGHEPEAAFTRTATAGSEAVFPEADTSLAGQLGQLLSAIAAFIRRFVVLSTAQAVVCALWVLHTHALDASDFTPYLNINSPVLGSGKTLLLEVLKLLAKNQWFTGRTTASALVRKIDAVRPTLLLDESDTAFHAGSDYSEHLRGILDSGYERDGTYSMSIPKGNGWEYHDFSTFSPKAIAGLGQLPATVQARSLQIKLKRATRNEPKQRFRKAKVKPEADQLRELAEWWAKKSIALLRASEPVLPDALSDRAQDVCEPLVAIADLAGGEWPSGARSALVALCTNQQIADDSIGLRLLADIREVFAGVDEIRTEDLLSRLNALGESPWSEFNHGRPLSSYGLAKLLKPFEIHSRNVRVNQSVRKGYLKSDFEDSWERYLSPPPPVSRIESATPLQTSVHAGPRHFSTPATGGGCSGSKNAEIAAVYAGCSGVADLSSTTGRNGRSCHTHPANKENWWKRGDDPVCGFCHPNPRARQ